MKKNSLEMFIAKKLMKDKKCEGVIEYSIEGSDEKLIINKLEPDRIMELQQHFDKERPMREYYAELVYMAIPELREKEMLEKFECTENPVSIVKKIFTVGEIVEMGQKLSSVIDDVDIEEVKN